MYKLYLKLYSKLGVENNKILSLFKVKGYVNEFDFQKKFKILNNSQIF